MSSRGRRRPRSEGDGHAGYRVAAGRRLRVQISSGAFPRWARNLGGGEPLAQATELHSATQSIYHSPTHPSAVILPVCPA